MVAWKTGEPLEGVRVTIFPDRTPTNLYYVRSWPEAVTGPDGRFRLTRLPAPG